jgi:DNA-binding MarR family transcriptional regulator
MAAEDSGSWMDAWMMLIRTHTRLWDEIGAHMQRESGLTMARYDVLAHLNMAGGRLGLSELASAVALSPSGLSKLLDRMDASGLIRRKPDPNDARAAIAAITPRGRTLVESARTSHHELLRQTFGKALNDRDIADLTRIMARINASIPQADG